MPPEFPPGSIGAQNAGCICDDEDTRDFSCPLHGFRAMIQSGIDAFEEAEAEHRADRQRHAKRRLVKALPVILALFALPTILSIAFPLWIAECILWSVIIGALAVQWAWRDR